MVAVTPDNFYKKGRVVLAFLVLVFAAALAQAQVFTSSLLGNRPASSGQAGAQGVALVWLDGSQLSYALFSFGTDAPTAAHIHQGRAGQEGPVTVNLNPSFSALSGAFVATGSLTLSDDTAASLRNDPGGFYLNVHNAEFSDGALRGQLGTGETILHLPVVADVPGLPPSLFRTAASITNFSDAQAEVWAEWYPASRTARAAPAAVTRFALPARGTAVFANLVSELFAASGRGAVRLLSPAPIAAAVNIFNDQRASGGGTFGQFAQGVTPGQALSRGVLPYNLHRPKSDGTGWRTNFGWFNPGPQAIELQVHVFRPDGTVAGSKSLTLQPWSNDLLACGDSNGYVPAAACNATNFTVAFSASAPALLSSSVVDNLTDDGLYQPAQPAPEEFVSPPTPANHPPTVTITSPAGNVTVQTGQVVNWVASATDPDGDSVTIVWDLGDGVTDTTNSLSVSHAWANAGTFTAP